MRDLLVMIHAGSGIAGLLVGLRLFMPPRTSGDHKSWRLLYGFLLTVLMVSLGAMIVYDWPDLDTTARVAFTGLLGLGVLILIRFFLAYRLADQAPSADPGSYVSHIYFTYVSLWVGFAIIPALRSPNPGLWIPVAVVGVLVFGSFLIHRYRFRIGVG